MYMAFENYPFIFFFNVLDTYLRVLMIFFFNSELEKITSELGAEKEGHAATLSGSQSLTAELEAERANLAVQVNELSALKEQHTG